MPSLGTSFFNPSSCCLWAYFSPLASFTSSPPSPASRRCAEGRRLDPRWQRRTKYLRAMAATNKSLARTNKSRTGSNATKKRTPVDRRTCRIRELIKMRAILLATVAGILLAGNVVTHADCRKTPLTPGSAVKDAQYDFKDLRTKRPNEPPPTQAGKLEGGIKIEHEPGSIVYRVDMYPNYVAKIQLEKWYKDVLVPKPEIADILPPPNCKLPLIGKKVPPDEETTGQTVKNENACNALIIQANTPPNPN